ncbi:hypothetical protein WJX74_006220 [Apatococcus lobatus]|uniref:RNA helicase n=1 Tax=Apatococcus lobatus TaxID=904363 RepID=A0AAW1RDL1_9CHLO
MNDTDDSPPPGFENVAAGTHDVPGVNGHSSIHEAGNGGAAPQSQLQDPETDDIRTVQHPDTPYSSAKSFDELPINQELLQGLYNEMKFERPSRVQADTLPMILNPPFRNLVAQAHNGSGKTTCFVLALLGRVDVNTAQPQCLCMCPTRELVVQNMQVLQRLGRYTKITSTSTASDRYEIATRQTRITEQVIIGTHGKMKTWVTKGALATRYIKLLVFDEADEMLKADGFGSDSVRLIRQLQKDSATLQILLFSATFDERVRMFAQKVAGPDANQLFIPKEELSLEVIKQYRVMCSSQEDKERVLSNMIFPNCERLGQTIIFVQRRETGRRLHTAMEAAGHRCTSIQGDMGHEARDRVISEFRSGATKILIATDVLARGFDVTQVTLVVNFDVPTERDSRRPAFETYLHRIGRSGRFGRRGAAFNLVATPQERDIVDSIQDYFKHEIPSLESTDEDRFIAVLHDAGLTDVEA